MSIFIARVCSICMPPCSVLLIASTSTAATLPRTERKGKKQRPYRLPPDAAQPCQNIMGDLANKLVTDVSSNNTATVPDLPASAEVICEEFLKVLGRKEVEQPMIWYVQAQKETRVFMVV